MSNETPDPEEWKTEIGWPIFRSDSVTLTPPEVGPLRSDGGRGGSAQSSR